MAAVIFSISLLFFLPFFSSFSTAPNSASSSTHFRVQYSVCTTICRYDMPQQVCHLFTCVCSGFRKHAHINECDYSMRETNFGVDHRLCPHAMPLRTDCPHILAICESHSVATGPACRHRTNKRADPLQDLDFLLTIFNAPSLLTGI